MDFNYKLLLYFDNRLYLNRMQIHCTNFLQMLNEKTISKFPPLRFLLEIDALDLLEAFPDLGELLVKEPLKWQSICNEILFSCVRATDNVYAPNIERAQTVVNVRLKCVPKILSQKNSRVYEGLTVIEGLLLNVSQPVSYAYQTVWSCPEECEGNEVILQYIPKVPPKCFMCKSVLFENSGLRRCGDKVTATFKLKEELLPKNFMVVDDLISKLQLGSLYILHIVVLKKITAVWSLEEILPLKAPINCSIPNDIDVLLNACDRTPWKFIYCLASSIGINICPLNCFMHLKISLLLSLASVKANLLTGSNILHVLAGSCSDARFVGEIMHEAAKLADRSISFGFTNTSVVTSLIASSGGICTLQLPLHIYNQKQVSTILTAVETGEIVSETTNTKLECAVWAQGISCKRIDLYNVASIFGTICRGDFGDYNDDVIDFMLQQAMDPVDIGIEETKALKDLVDYVNITAGIEVYLNEDTEVLLRNYFLAARRERPRCVSVGSMGALVASCFTSARLCRRNVTNVDDAVLAIWLHVSGSPEPRFAPDEYLESAGDVKKLQIVMNNFKVWLKHFTGCIIS